MGSDFPVVIPVLRQCRLVLMDKGFDGAGGKLLRLHDSMCSAGECSLAFPETRPPRWGSLTGNFQRRAQKLFHLISEQDCAALS